MIIIEYIEAILLTQLFMQDFHILEVYVNCSICIAVFIILQREPREARKLIDVAHRYKGNMDKLIVKYLKH